MSAAARAQLLSRAAPDCLHCDPRLRRHRV